MDENCSSLRSGETRHLRISSNMRNLYSYDVRDITFVWKGNINFRIQKTQYLLTPWSIVHFDKLIVAHLINKFPVIYGTWRFITVFTRARHRSLSWATWIQSTSSYSNCLRSLRMHIYYLSIHSYVFLVVFRQIFRLTSCMNFSYLRCVLHAPPIPSSWCDYPNNICWKVGQQIIKLITEIIL
jgi:hypothetical protein